MLVLIFMIVLILFGIYILLPKKEIKKEEEEIPDVDFTFLQNETQQYEAKIQEYLINRAIKQAVERGQTNVKIDLRLEIDLVNMTQEVFDKILEKYNNEVAYKFERHDLILFWETGKLLEETNKNKQKIIDFVNKYVNKQLYHYRINGSCTISIRNIIDELEKTFEPWSTAHVKIKSEDIENVIVDICRTKNLKVEIQKPAFVHQFNNAFVYWQN